MRPHDDEMIVWWCDYMFYNYMLKNDDFSLFFTKASPTDRRTDKPGYRDARTHLKRKENVCDAAQIPPHTTDPAKLLCCWCYYCYCCCLYRFVPSSVTHLTSSFVGLVSYVTRLASFVTIFLFINIASSFADRGREKKVKQKRDIENNDNWQQQRRQQR